ncbi:MAG: hypothetical protein OXH96_19795 [Spirochaetaceae bacterium]|nr:hypothetical protein [Spirochaetaceae bacterium]MDE0448913.1 hypothetical protein [Spirochaetaceae bacterium]
MPGAVDVVLHWQERRQALVRGAPGAFDERAVFTPTVMVTEAAAT